MDINELTYQINGAVYEVNRELGAGFKIGLLINFKHPKADIKRFIF